MEARHIARETATLSRLRKKRKSRVRGTSSAPEVAIEYKTTAASRSCNLSTGLVSPIRTPCPGVPPESVCAPIFGLPLSRLLEALRHARLTYLSRAWTEMA